MKVFGTDDFVQMVYVHIGEHVSFLTHSWRNTPVFSLLLANRMVPHHCLSVRECCRKCLNFLKLCRMLEKNRLEFRLQK